jgi:hypothetical protein
MSELSRRMFLSSGAGVAAAGVAIAAMPGIASVAPAATDAVSEDLPVAIDELSAVGPLVVHIRDAATGEVSVLRDETEVVFHDPSIIRRIVAAANGN